MSVRIGDFVARCATGPLADFCAHAPWDVTSNAESIVRVLIQRLDGAFERLGEARVHASAIIEPGAQIKGPAFIGPKVFIAATALVRGGVFLDQGCIDGPACELKSSFVFAGSKLAHLNFVGDSVIGEDVNIEAGAMIANYRNERADKRIRIRRGADWIDTGIDKFGALIGDGARIGANAVIAPGALLDARTIVPRLALIDQG